MNSLNLDVFLSKNLYLQGKNRKPKKNLIRYFA